MESKICEMNTGHCIKNFMQCEVEKKSETRIWSLFFTTQKQSYRLVEGTYFGADTRIESGTLEECIKLIKERQKAASYPKGSLPWEKQND